MIRHLSSEDVERFRARSMQAPELLAFYDHISDCAQCREQVNRSERPQNAFASLLMDLNRESLTGGEHLVYEQLASYVDAGLMGSDREKISAHLELCADCSDRVDELRSFKASLTSSKPVSAGLWERLARAWRVRSNWILIPAQVAATLLVALICVWFLTFHLRTKVTDLQAQRDQLQRDNQDLQKTSATVLELESKLAQLQRDHDDTLARVEDLQAQLLDAHQGPGDKPAGDLSQDLISLNDGRHTIRVDKLGAVAGLGSLSERDERAIRAALTTQNVEAPADIAELARDRSGLLRGGNQGVAFALVSPLGSVVESDRPLLRWSKLSGASAYIVSVFDSNFNRVVVSPSITSTEWRSEMPLERGRIYSWQVTAVRGDDRIKSPTTPAPEARFKVLDAARASELEKAQRTYHDSHLMKGLLYAREGLLDEAEREFKALLEKNPRSPVAEKLLRSVKRLRVAGSRKSRK